MWFSQWLYERGVSISSSLSLGLSLPDLLEERKQNLASDREIRGHVYKPTQHKEKNTTTVVGRVSLIRSVLLLLASPYGISRTDSVLSNNNINQRHLLSSRPAGRPFKLPHCLFWFITERLKLFKKNHCCGYFPVEMKYLTRVR